MTFQDEWTSDCGTVRLICGDCLEVLPTLGKMDVCITDPPYGQKTHEGARTGSGEGGGEILIDFASISDEVFIDVCKAIVGFCNRWVVMTCEWQHAIRLEELGFLVRLGVWVKPNPTPQFTGDRPGTGWEAVAICHRKGRKRWNGGGHCAVWTCNKISGQHPTQKPLPLVTKWVELFSDYSETIFDPFMGSGTTGVACVRTGRKFIGIEREPKYFEIAKRRISDELNRFPLLEKVESPQQMTLQGEDDEPA